jgi:hypothetical protein
MYKIFDDCISKEVADEIEKHLVYYDFCWHYLPNTLASDTEDSPQMSHVFYGMKDGQDIFSRDFKTIMQPLLSEVNVNTDINIEDRTLWRAKANLLFPTCDRQLEHSLPHIDSNDKQMRNGDTLLFEDDKKTIVKRISPKKGRFLFFDGDIWHASTNPVKSMKRIVININLSVL